jgi:hypothetical protein
MRILEKGPKNQSGIIVQNKSEILPSENFDGLTMATASLAASAMMSAHDTVRGQVSSSVDLAAAMTSNPLTDKFGN